MALLVFVSYLLDAALQKDCKLSLVATQTCCIIYHNQFSERARIDSCNKNELMTPDTTGVIFPGGNDQFPRREKLILTTIISIIGYEEIHMKDAAKRKNE